MKFINIFPLTKLRFNILTELYQNSFNLSQLSYRLNKSRQLIFQTLSSMEMIEKDKNDIYFLKSEFIILFEKSLKFNLLHLRMGKYFDTLSFIKKYTNPSEMFLFGSCARDEMHENSDIDIYIISSKNENEIADISRRISKLIHIDIQIISVKPSVHLTNKDKYFQLYKDISSDINKGIKIDLETI